METTTLIGSAMPPIMVAQIILAVIGQFVFGLYFIYSGVKHLTQMKGMVGYAGSKGVPMPGFLVPFSGLMLIVGGLSVVTGLYVGYGLALLAIFMAIVTPVMHNFWAEKDAMSRMNSKIHFTKNLAILGAVLLALALVNSWPWVAPISL
ncbi:MAG: DoxX family protein [Patescibacteria group bacterium]